MSPDQVIGLTLVLAAWLAMELGVVAWREWKHRQEDRAIRGEFDTHLPAHWKEEDVERSRADFLRVERNRRRAR